MTARHVQETRFALTPDSPASLPDDGALLLAWSRGRDEAAFTRFVQRHLGMVQGRRFAQVLGTLQVLEYLQGKSWSELEAMIASDKQFSGIKTGTSLGK